MPSRHGGASAPGLTIVATLYFFTLGRRGRHLLQGPDETHRGISLKKIAVVASAIWLASASGGLGQVSMLTGSQLLDYCADANDPRFGICIGYIRGVTESMVWGSPVYGFAACVPGTVPHRQVVSVVEKFQKDHLEKSHLGAASIVAAALSGAFPCD